MLGRSLPGAVSVLLLLLLLLMVLLSLSIVLVLVLLLLLLLRLLPAVYLIISFQLAPFGNQSLHSVFALATFT